METIQLCPPAIREAIARARAAIEQVSPQAHADLAAGAEAAAAEACGAAAGAATWGATVAAGVASTSDPVVMRDGRPPIAPGRVPGGGKGSIAAFAGAGVTVCVIVGAAAGDSAGAGIWSGASEAV